MPLARAPAAPTDTRFRFAVHLAGWNKLDFLVVCMGYVALGPSGNYSAVRTVRVLRPLRSISKIHQMRVLVLGMLKALPMLLDVVGLCSFAFLVFGIVGLQLYAGVLKYRCGVPDFTNATLVPSPPPSLVQTYSSVSYKVTPGLEDSFCSGRMSDETVWVDDGGTPALLNAGPPGTGYVCPSSTLESDGQFCTSFRNPNEGFTSFDNILWAWLTIFQCITMEGWTDVMYFTMVRHVTPGCC